MNKIDFSFPPSVLIELSKRIEDIAIALGIEYKTPPFGRYSLASSSENLINIGKKIGLNLQIVNSINKLQCQLIEVLNHLKH